VHDDRIDANVGHRIHARLGLYGGSLERQYSIDQPRDIQLTRCASAWEFKELSASWRISANELRSLRQARRSKLTSPDQVLLSGVLQSGAVASVHLKGAPQRTGFLFRSTTEATWLSAGRPSPGALHTGLRVSLCGGAQRAKPLADLSIPESYRWIPPAVPAGLPFTLRSCTCGWLKAFAKEGPSDPF